MNPLLVWARNFRTYESVEWQIPSGLTAIVGKNATGEGADSNGSGKSSLLELLPIALFGPPLPWTEYLTAGGEADLCEVGCELEHAGERYRIRRTFSAKGRGSSKLDFEWLVPDDKTLPGDSESGWNPLTRAIQQDTQEVIAATLHLSEAVFAHSVYAAQGARHFADPSLPPREKKAILAEALGLDIWERKVELVRADKSETTAELAAIEVRLGTFAEQVGQLPLWRDAHARYVEDVAATEQALAAAEQVAAEAAAGLAARQAATARYDGLVATSQAAEAREKVLLLQRAKATEARQALPELDAQITVLTTSASTVDELTAAVAAQQHSAEARGQALREQERLKVELTKLRDKAKRLLEDEAAHGARASRATTEIAGLKAEGSGICDHCKQPIQGESLTAALASLEHDVAALQTKAAELRAELEETVAQGQAVTQALGELVIPEDAHADTIPAMKLLEARQAERDLAAAQERRRQLVEVAATLTEELAAEHDQAVIAARLAAEARTAATPEASPVDWAASVAEADRLVAAARAEDIAKRTNLAASAEKIRNLEELAGRSEEAVLAKGLLDGRLDHLKQMEVAYGKNGIPALLMEAHGIPQVEREASRVLEMLGVPFRIELVTQREKKSGGLADTLDVVVHGPDGPLRFESYSGGEQQRLAFALKIALARLVVSRSGSQIGALFIDEMPFLDTAGMVAVAEVLRGLTEFRSIVLVSHDERLVDAFDSVITVVRDDAGSRLEAV